VAKRILVIEDNDDLRQYFRDVVSTGGFDVEEASDGLKALRQLDKSAA
jgi:CheY-like chemotaxis protein